MARARPRQPLLEAVVTLPFAFRCEAAIAGRTFRIVVGGHTFRAVTPAFVDGQHDRPLLRPPRFRTVRADIDWYEYLDDPWAWGSVTSWSRGAGAAGVTTFALSHVKVHATFETPEELTAASDALFDRIDSWLRMVGDWVEIVTSQNIGDTLVSGADSRSLHAWGYDGTSFNTLQGPHIQTVTINQKPTLTLDQWRRILVRANRGEAPPLEHQLLRDSRRLLHRGEHRRAVLDAATAAELAASAIMDRYVRTVPSAVRDLAVENRRELGRKVAALRKLGFTLPTDIDAALVQVRNRAIHQGAEPAEAEAARSIAIASALVTDVIPTSALLSPRTRRPRAMTP